MIDMQEFKCVNLIIKNNSIVPSLWKFLDRNDNELNSRWLRILPASGFLAAGEVSYIVLSSAAPFCVSLP